MPEPLRTVFEFFGQGTPLWLFALVVLLHFYFGHLRLILKDRQDRQDARSATENANKEKIIGLIEAARQISLEIGLTYDHLISDVSVIVRNTTSDDESAEEMAMSYIGEFDAARLRLGRFMKQVDEFDVFDGSHDNIIRIQTLLGEIRAIKSIGENARVKANTEYHKLLQGRL